MKTFRKKYKLGKTEITCAVIMTTVCFAAATKLYLNTSLPFITCFAFFCFMSIIGNAFVLAGMKSSNHSIEDEDPSISLFEPNNNGGDLITDPINSWYTGNIFHNQ